jgi:NADH dehydrogenase FAD-containing subunit
VGAYAAMQLERHLRGPDDEIVLVNAENYLQYQPFLPEAASGTIDPATWSSRYARSCGAPGSWSARRKASSGLTCPSKVLASNAHL